MVFTKNLGNSYTEGYGVVKGYSNDSDSDLWYLDMQSNARIKTPGAGIGLRSFEWEITKDNKKATLTDWTPSSTIVAKTEGFPISVSLELPKFKGITPTVGTDFALFQKKDTLQAGASSSKYSFKYYNNPDSGVINTAYLLYYPNYQDLNAVVEYDLNGRDTEWSWTWKMGYNFLY